MLRVFDLENTALPQEFVDLLPKECDICGSATEITETLTMLRCANPQCPEKAVQRMVALMKDIGVKNMGESKCRSFLYNFNVFNPYAIFMYEPDVDGPLYEGCSMDFSESIFEAVQEKKTMLLWEFIKIGNLPGIRDIARKIFIEYDNLDEFYDDMEAGGISFIQKLIGVKGTLENESSSSFDDLDEEDNFISVKAVAIYNTLMQFKEELIESANSVDIMSLDTPVINICISTAVGKPYKSKTDFVSQMNEQYGDKVHLNFLGSVTKDCQFLIWSKEGVPTSKVGKATRYGIPVMTGKEFREYLEEL